MVASGTNSTRLIYCTSALPVRGPHAASRPSPAHRDARPGDPSGAGAALHLVGGTQDDGRVDVQGVNTGVGCVAGGLCATAMVTRTALESLAHATPHDHEDPPS